MAVESIGTRDAVAERLILEAKLLSPTPTAGWLERPRLVDELERAAGTRLTLVSAPVGSGKSTLVAQWAESHRDAVAWLTLDSNDDTPIAFWTYVLAALRTLDPRFGEAALLRLQAPGTAMADDVLPLLANSLFGLGPATLVLDDFQTIAHEEIHQGLLFLLERLPPRFRIVIVTQSDPRFPLTRLRGRGQLAEIRDLAFSLDESRQLLGRELNVELAAADLHAIHEHTEGWVAGLQLAALSARGRKDPVAFLLDGLADNRHVLGLLWDEVLARQPPDVRSFLIQTSILGRFSPSLCVAVTGREDAEALILQLERHNVFIVSLDAGGHWHRFHQLFRHALARQRSKLPAHQLAALHRRASDWYVVHGRRAEAIEHSLQAGDIHVAAGGLARAWVPLFSTGHATTISDWLDRFPPDVIAGQPSLCLLASGINYACDRLETAEHWLAVFDAQRAPPDELPGYSQTPVGAAAIIRGMLALARGNLTQALHHGRQAYEMEAEEGKTLVGHHLGLILLYADDQMAAEPLLTSCLTDQRTAGHHAHAVTALGYQAAIALERGDTQRARWLARDALDRADAHHLNEYGLTSVAESAFGVALATDGDLAAAQEHLERGVALAKRGARRYEGTLAQLQCTAGKLRLGDLEGARDALAAARVPDDIARLPWLARIAQDLTRQAELPRRHEALHDATNELTPAELEVLRILPTDLTYPEIAQRLFVSINTVKTHTSHIRRKLGVGSRAEAVASARQIGLL